MMGIRDSERATPERSFQIERPGRFQLEERFGSVGHHFGQLTTTQRVHCDRSDCDGTESTRLTGKRWSSLREIEQLETRVANVAHALQSL
jgi:hypothetical protein